MSKYRSLNHYRTNLGNITSFCWTIRLMPGLVSWHHHRSPLSSSVDPEVILLLRTLYKSMIDWMIDWLKCARPTRNCVAVFCSRILELSTHKSGDWFLLNRQADVSTATGRHRGNVRPFHGDMARLVVRVQTSRPLNCNFRQTLTSALLRTAFVQTIET